MPKRTTVLDSVNVSSPCSAHWDEMTGNDQVRFCQHCSLSVNDLSKITRKDAIRLVTASKGKLCVRYYRRPDGTLNTASRAQPLSHIKRRLSRLATGAFTATLSLAATAAAQSAQPPERSQLVVIQPATVRDGEPTANPGGQTGSLAGTVLDSQGAVVPGAGVHLINEETGREQNVVSDEDGAYQFQDVEAGTYRLSIEASGFITYQQEKIAVQSGSEQRVDATLDVGEALTTMGVVVMTPETPLINAIWNDDMLEIKNLLAAGVDVNALDKSVDSTALAEAAGAGSLELVQTLLYTGADPNGRNNSGRTALMRLDDDATAEIVRALVDAGAKVNLKDKDGDSALHVAAALEKTEVLQALLDAGAKVNARNKEGKTALMIASENGWVDNVNALLIAGANVHRKDNEGKTALQYARESEHVDSIIAALAAYGAYE